MVIPVHDDNPTRRTPWVTYILIALNIIIFFAEPIAKSPTASADVAQVCKQDRYFSDYAAIPKELTHNQPLSPHRTIVRTDNGDVPCPIVDEHNKQPWFSVLTAMFLHGSLLHLLGNMLFLWVFGNNVEDRLGHLGYLFFYLLCGYAAAYGFALAYASSVTPLIGASGAIAGVLGAYFVFFPLIRVTTLLFIIPVRLPAWLVLGGWFVLQWLYSRGNAVAEGAGVAYLAHIVGFIVGAVIALPLLMRRRRALRPT